MENGNGELLTAQQVEKMLGLSHATVHRLRKGGVFPEPIRVGLRAVRWPKATVVRYLKERTGAAVQEA